MSQDFSQVNFVEMFIEEAKETLFNWEKTCLALQKEFTENECSALFRYAHNLKGSSRSVGLEKFGSFIHKVEDLITEIRENRIKFSSEILAILLESQSLLTSWCDKLLENPDGDPEKTSEIELKILKIFLDSPKFQENEFIDFNKLVANGNQNQVVIEKNNENIKTELKEKPKSEVSVKNKETAKSQSVESIRVPANKIDSIMHLISELSTSQAVIDHSKSIQNYSSKTFNNAVNNCTKLIKDLQTLVLSLRMQPVSSLFQRLERVGMDVARDQKKPLQIKFSGEHVELDKTILERILDPFVHIIRNAVDHGIEPVDVRLQNKKNEIATLNIDVIQNSGQIVISIMDDGKGIDTNTILKKAKEKGLVDSNAVMKNKDILQLILLPGFSTAEKVTDISGRGVGLDVVQQVLNEIGGDLQIESKLGLGSRFEVYLPTNLSIIDVLTVKIEKLSYVIPIQEIREVIDISEFDIDQVTQMERLLTFRKAPIIVKNLGDCLCDYNFSDTPSRKERKLKPAIICENKGHTYAFEIDEIIGQQSIVARKLNGKLEKIKYYCGCSLLPNGEPALILSVKELILTLEKKRNDIEALL